MTTSRRAFLQTILLAPAVIRSWAADAAPRVRFGVISDVHQDVMHDGVQRVAAFADAMGKTAPDFVIQLGDFCRPQDSNREFLSVWNRIKCPRHHVLGNHDMDGGFKREQTAEFYGMPALHYSFDAGPVRGIVLDGNEPGGKLKGYARFIGKAQQEWLAAELDRDAKPALVFVHQPLDDAGGIENAAEIAAIFEKSIAKRPGCVAAVFAGHLHRDYVRSIAGIPSVQINSASYVWLSGKMCRETYAPEIHKAHPFMKDVAAYRDPLWACVTVDRDAGHILIEGRGSEWVGPDPWGRGATEQMCRREECRPVITSRTIPVVKPAAT